MLPLSKKQRIYFETSGFNEITCYLFLVEDGVQLNVAVNFHKELRIIC